MSQKYPAASVLILMFVLPLVLCGCSSSSISIEQADAPDQDPEGQVEPVVEPVASPTSYPKGQAQFSITRSGTITAGLGGAIEVSGEFPIDIYFTEGEEIGAEILYSEGMGTAIMSYFGEGTIGTGEIISIWDARFQVRGVFIPAPDCSLELSITEIWEGVVEVSAIVNGQTIVTGQEPVDEFIIWTDNVHEFSNIKFPWGIGKVVEDTLDPSTDWVNTYEVTSLSVPVLTGCDIKVE
ncbi:MAG: hypothetical protein E4G99_11800 [Anaerolineales bacterium]|nr:MAG: hypothetical protein E4G99_11800 [Anaerolineales bacterium]